jgi:precorrin-6B methylase 2
MSFEELMGVVSRWSVATEALSAIGAQLSLSRQPDGVDPRVSDALRAVSAAAGVSDIDTLSAEQRDMASAVIRMYLHEATDLVDDPARGMGWSFTDEAILQGWGRGSMMVPRQLAAAPELANVHTFLDVGTGVGLLAIAAARVWPQATIVGIDVWEPSLDAASANVRRADLEGRITIRNQDVAMLDDVETYECAWVPTFFLSESALDNAMPRLVRSLRPGGWLVLGRFVVPPDPLAAATTSLRIIRGGGTELGTDDLIGRLGEAGCTAVRALPRTGPAPLEYVVGQRP